MHFSMALLGIIQTISDDSKKDKLFEHETITE